MRPGEGQPLLLHAVSDQRLQGLHSGGQLEVLQAAVLDLPDADIGQGRDAPLQLDSCDAGCSWILFLISLLVSWLIFLGLPETGFLGGTGKVGFFLAKARSLLRVDSDILSCFLIVAKGTPALQSSTAALLESFLNLCLACLC